VTARTLLLILSSLAALPAHAQSPAGSQTAPPEAPGPIDYATAHLSRIVTAARITEPITLDGRLDEPAWPRAGLATDFIQRQPRPGELSQDRTEVRFLYDGDNLYVGFWCFDSDPDRMFVNGLEQDFRHPQSDSVILTIDSLNDGQSGFEFATNPAGARYDTQFANNGDVNNADWDGVWDVKTSRTEEGWFAEFMIPFKTLRFSDSSSQEWGVNMSRRILRVNEVANWSPIPTRYISQRVEYAGTLRGLEGVRQGRNLRLKPFLTGGLTQVRGADGQLRTVQAFDRLKDQDGGVDLKYSLTPSLTLDATYRTDFAHVEVDQQQVNLTRFNLFFPEKRDFFLENSGIFSVGQGDTRFGTGGARNLLPFFSRRIGLGPAGTPVPILGGARLSGKVRDYDVGFLQMRTERQGATAANNYTVGRVRRNLLRSSWIGALVTSREGGVAGDYNRVYGTDAHFQLYDRLELDGYLLQSATPGRSGRSQARRFQTMWRDEELTINGEYNTVQPNFNPELGFVRRQDMVQYFGQVLWEPQLVESPTIRTLNFGTSLDYYEGSASGRLETRVQEGTVGISFDSGGSMTFAAEQTFDRFVQPLSIPAGTPRATIPAGDHEFLAYTARFSTSAQRMLSGNGSITWGDFYDGRRTAVSGGVAFAPSYHLILNVGYERNDVTLANGSFVTNLFRTRSTYAFTPSLVLHAFIQYNADTSQVSSNIRFNWTHRPLSDLYLVYNDTRDTLTGLTRERALVLKFTQLFSF
jgi:hypothetical protein